jgi:hypothetical protein
MTYPAHASDGQISRADNMAIRKEVGERLRTSLDQNPVRMTPHLLMLMARLREEPARIQPHPPQ